MGYWGGVDKIWLSVLPPYHHRRSKNQNKIFNYRKKKNMFSIPYYWEHKNSNNFDILSNENENGYDLKPKNDKQCYILGETT